MTQLLLSLFPGLGLLDMAFEEEGFCVVRGPDVLWGGDIRRFHPPAGKFDGIIGGPPCQSFSSLAHLVRANGHEPKFGNLIPEFERCVVESQCDWFLMENVPQAPTPTVAGYAVKDCLINNAWLDAGDGYGCEQERKRRFSFGVRGAGPAPNLMRWIQTAALLLPEALRSNAATQAGPGPNTRDKARQKPVTGMHCHPDNVTAWSKTRKRTVTALGNDHLDRLAKSTEKVRHPAVAAGGDGGGPGRPDCRKGAVTNSDGSGQVKQCRYTFADACRLQGLPEDFLADAPFTAAGKMKAVANGVPLTMGRAIAKAVRMAIEERA